MKLLMRMQDLQSQFRVQNVSVEVRVQCLSQCLFQSLPRHRDCGDEDCSNEVRLAVTIRCFQSLICTVSAGTTDLLVILSVAI
jgi:hypothetical protein